MEVDKLEAGDELDAMIAERVMGWACPTGYNYWMTLHGGGTFDLHALKANWHPSISIATAWEVVTKLAAERMVKLYNEGAGGQWYWEFFIWTKGSHVKARAETAPLAICRAALLLATCDSDGDSCPESQPHSK